MFITVEGIEGSGKSTQAKLLSDWLEEIGIRTLLTKEPGSVISKECKQIRRLLLDPESNLARKSEFFLYLADRAQHVDKVIRPAISGGKWVVSDRYSDSTYVYQGWGRKLSTEDILPIIKWAQDEIVPDITFIMDLPAKIGLERARSTNTEFEGGDRFELEEVSFHERLRTGFLQVHQNNQFSRTRLIDAEKTIEEIHEEIKQVLRQYMDEHEITITPA